MKNNPYLGGIMLWDASFDTNNIIDGRPYSWHLKQFLYRPPEIVVCIGPKPPVTRSSTKTINYRWIGCAVLAVVLMGFIAMGYFIFKLNKSKQMKKNQELKYQMVHDL